MAVRLLGFTIGRTSKEEQSVVSTQAFSLPENEDAALTIDGGPLGAAYGTYLDLDGVFKTENDLITRYREMSLNPEVDIAIDDIVNESVVTEAGKPPVSISLGNVDIPDKIKSKIRSEFFEIQRLLGFYDFAYDIFKKWYVDGRLYYHILIDLKNPKNGIQELRSIDPRQIKKVREVREQKQINGQLIALPTNAVDYYTFFPEGSNPNNTSGIKIARDSISYTHSGILNSEKTMILGHLHKAIKPMNQLRMLEDATVIYRIARAPERRIFYVDVGNLPKVKAEQYLRGIMSQYKNKLIYDSTTGEVRDDRKHMSMLEDFWLPRREGGRGTEITTLPGGTNLGEIEDIIYFKKKLYKALGVPVSRLEPEGSFSLGRATEITRDEVKFGKYVNRLRARFSSLFDNLLGTQLQLKGIISSDDWEEIKQTIYYDYHQDSHFAELKQVELLRDRTEIAQTLDEYIGRFYSNEWVRKNVLMQTEEDIDRIDAQIEQEKKDGEEHGEGEDDAEYGGDSFK